MQTKYEHKFLFMTKLYNNIQHYTTRYTIIGFVIILGKKTAETTYTKQHY